MCCIICIPILIKLKNNLKITNQTAQANNYNNYKKFKILYLFIGGVILKNGSIISKIRYNEELIENLKDYNIKVKSKLT